MTNTIDQLARQLLTGEDKAFTIYSHKRPDGDTIGSAYALALALQALGCRTQNLCSDAIPDVYRRLTDQVPAEAVEGAAGFSVDASTPERLGTYADAPIRYCIDHHEGNTIEAAYKYVDPGASSCAQLVYALIVRLGVEVTPLMAELLYTGLATDTNGFRTVSTNYDSLQTAAELVRCGADPAAIAKRHFGTKSRKRMDAEQAIIDSFRYTHDGQILSAVLDYETRTRIGIDPNALEGINALVDQVEGVRFGIVVREYAPKKCRISVRAAEGLRADLVCAQFGGGGHRNAAGGEAAGDAETVRALVEAACEKELG